MNSLLKRQIRKYLPKNLQSNKDLEFFLDAINKSYNTSDEQFIMLQRAASISSEELFGANKQLRDETISQKRIIKKLESVIADKFAAFSFKVDCETAYKVVGTKESYSEDSEEFTTTDERDLELELGLSLDSNEFVNVDGRLLVKIDPIYFDLDKSFIRPDAAIELAKVVQIMKKYPNIKIASGSHTDSRASDQYNWALSNRRAKSSVAWIVSQGIDPSRITGQGYGETKLVNRCSDGVKCSEEEHQLNRRTEFVIVNPEVINQ